MTPQRRRSAWAVGALAFAAFAWWAMRPAAVPVEIGAASRGPLQVSVDEEGETRVRQRFVIAAPASGRLLRIALDEGDAVAVGDVLAEIVPAPLDPRDRAAAEARLAAAEDAKQAAVARAALADAALAQAERDLARAERLREAGARSDEALERARLERIRALREREAARSATAMADHEADAARAVLMAARTSRDPAALATSTDDPCATPGTCIALHAPVAGHVLRVREESERVVPAGTPLLELGDPRSIEIVVDVLSADAVKIRPGADLWVEDWGGTKALRATVRRVEPSAFTKISALGVEEQRVNVIGDFVDTPDGLGDGYRIEARILVWQADDVLRVPTGALFRHGEGWAVFVVEGGVARQREVTIGARGPFEAEVQEGLAPGEAVVVHPSDRVADGVRVKEAGR